MPATRWSWSSTTWLSSPAPTTSSTSDPVAATRAAAWSPPEHRPTSRSAPPAAPLNTCRRPARALPTGHRSVISSNRRGVSVTDALKRRQIQEIGAEQSRRRSISLGSAFAEFVRHPSPWTLLTLVVGGAAVRLVHGDWRLSDAILPVVLAAVFPVYEWLIHVFVLHWKPRRIGRLTIDSILARKHRLHHADPRDVPLVFIPWQALFWIVPSTVAISVFAFGRLGLGLTFLVTISTAGLGYEWVHFLVHSDYRPASRPYRAIWNNHRLHHYKNEHYWFTVTSSGTADRLFRTHPDPAAVPKSRTARNLHALSNVGIPDPATARDLGVDTAVPTPGN